MGNRIDAMTDEQIADWMKKSNVTGLVDTPEWESFMADLSETEREVYFSRCNAILAKSKPHGARKFFKALGMLATFRFADAVEYMANGDTEN